MDFIPGPDELPVAAYIVPLLTQCVIIAVIWRFVRRQTDSPILAVAVTFATTLIVDVVLAVFLFVAFVIVFRLANPSII